MFTKQLMALMAEQRTTTYFKNLGVLSLCLAYRVLEYLRPDPHFTKPEYPLDPLVQDLIAARQFTEAAEEIWEQVQRGRIEELGCSSGTEHLKKMTADLLAQLVGEDQAKLDKAAVE